MGITDLDPHLYAYVNSNPLRFADPLGLRRWPFGAGKFCRDKSCRCEPPIKVLGEDSATFIPTPGPGGCVEADAVYSVECVLKIPDNMTCTLKCDFTAPPGQQGKLSCRAKPPILGQIAAFFFVKKPECIKEQDADDVPDGWPPNPFWPRPSS